MIFIQKLLLQKSTKIELFSHVTIFFKKLFPPTISVWLIREIILIGTFSAYDETGWKNLLQHAEN